MSLLRGIAAKPAPSTPPPAASTRKTRDDRVGRARKYLAKLPPAISGQGGHTATWNAARKLAQDFELSEEQVFQLLRDDYNPHCQPRWSDRELRHKARDAATKARVSNPVEDRDRENHWKMPSEHYDGVVDEPPGADDPSAPPSSGAQGTNEQQQPPRLRTLGDLLLPALERAELRRNGTERPIPLPFPQYSEILAGGYWPGVHNVIAGTGAGKSAFMFQTAVHAVRAGVPVLYIGLELGEMQVALRAVAEASGSSWSRLYTGRCTSKDLDRARDAIPALSSLPFYVEFNSAQGWAPSNLVTRAEQIRKAHPTGPMLVVLDFLQLVGAEPMEFGRAPELREKIARAAYCGVHVANKYGAAVALVSSTSRDKYGLMGGDMKSAGITTRHVPGLMEPARTILNPDALLGVGKEAGEIEFAAETQTVLLKWPAPLDNGERAVICAVPKLRYGPPSWVAMSFWQRFQELPFRDIGELPEVSGQGGRGKPVAGDELGERLKATVRRNPNLASKSAVVNVTDGTKSTLLKAFDQLLKKGDLVSTETGFAVRETENHQ